MSTSTLTLLAVAGAGVIAGTNEGVRKGVSKFTGTAQAMLDAGSHRFQQAEADKVEVSQVTRMPKQA